MEQVKIISKEHLTHDVLKITAEKPAGINYHPGQAVDISLNRPEWNEKKNAFTFTSLPEDNFIEFVIKTYPSHHGVTEQLLSVEKGDELLIHKPFGSISYQGEGIFLAGGSGITPFIAILKQLEKEGKVAGNKLIFANKTKEDIILEDTFKDLLGNNFINVLSDEKVENYEEGYISEELIKKHISENTKYFYLCGPRPMMKAVEEQLKSLGVTDEFIVKERF